MPEGAGAGVSVVVPVFNSELTLVELHGRIEAVLGSRPGLDAWELILVNDGSADESWKRIVALSADHSEVRGIDLTRNFGQHNALLAGIHAARYETVVTLDDDLQDRPEEIPRLLDELGPGVDLVYGFPRLKRRVLARRVATRVMRAVVWALSAGRIAFRIGGFRAFRTSLLDGVDSEQGANLAIDTPLGLAATGRVTITVVHDPRRHGRSNYTLGKLVDHAVTELRSLRPGPPRARRDATYVVRRTTGGAGA